MALVFILINLFSRQRKESIEINQQEKTLDTQKINFSLSLTIIPIFSQGQQSHRFE
jgi:hypothetical protein